MDIKKAFFYFIKIYGSEYFLRRGGPDDAITTYGNSFDSINFARAMSNEFERGEYLTRIRATIADGVSKVDFNEKFSFIALASFGEYSFANHAFPLYLLQEYQFCIGPRNTVWGGCQYVDVRAFRAQEAVNKNDFNWSVAMSEADASAFLKARTVDSYGKMDRRIAVRVTYSVMNTRQQEPGTNFYGENSHPIFVPFLYSIEAYENTSLTRRLGAITKSNAQGANTAEELRLARVAASTASKEIGKYRFLTQYRTEEPVRLENPLARRERPQTYGTITLTDAGITMVDEQSNVRTLTSHYGFMDLAATAIWRANFTDGTWGTRDFRVVWFPFWKHDHDAELRFESLTERDRFFTDLVRTIQEWKSKYSAYNFAAGQVQVDQRCEINTRFVPCSTSNPFELDSDEPESVNRANPNGMDESFDVPRDGLRVQIHAGTLKIIPVGGPVSIAGPRGMTWYATPDEAQAFRQVSAGSYLILSNPPGSERQVQVINNW
jgi:hypothetical protein